MNISVSLVSTFGPSIRGISPYADNLLTSLQALNDLSVEPVDYIKQYPNSLLPSKGKDNTATLNGHEIIHYAKPKTWDRFVEQAKEIVHIQYWSLFTVTYLYLIAKRVKAKRKRLVVTIHNVEQHEKIPLLHSIEKKFLCLCDAIICHNKTSATKLEERLGNLAPLIRVIHHGVIQPKNTEKKDVRQANCIRFELDPEKRYVLFFGNIRPYKGIDVLLDAWNDIKQKHQDTCLIIAGRLWNGERGILSSIVAKILGTSKYSVRIKNMAKDNSDSQLKYLLRFIEQDELEELIKISCLAVFPYLKFSGQSGAATLAAGFGTPVLVSDCGSLSELAIDNNFILDEIHRKNLADQLSNVLGISANSNDIHEQQLAKIRPYFWTYSALSHRELYQEIMDSG